MADVGWMEADDSENPFKVRIVNCLSTAMGLFATTQDAGIALKYGELRGSDGREHMGQVPTPALEVACDLRYPMHESLRDGAIHRSEEMEDKWDIYQHQGRLYFARSWTGTLTACADIQFAREQATVVRVSVASATAEEPAYAVRLVDFLIKSHIYGWRVPHPLPAGTPDDPDRIAIFSFSMFGRHGFAATFADTLPFRPQPPDPSG